MFSDLALTFDDLSRGCDVIFADDGDVAIDVTAATPLLMSVGLDRRALASNELPDCVTRVYQPSSFYERRGSALDALDRNGEFAGCRMWLLSRAKETEETRQLAEYALTESTFWAKKQTGVAAEVSAWWAARQLLRWSVATGEDTITLSRRIG